MAIDVEFEIRDLKRRVGELEGSFGFLIEQVKGVHRDLIGFQAETRERFDIVEGRLDRVELEVGELRGEVGELRGEVRQLREDMPGIVGDAMRDVLRGRNGG